MNLKNKIPFVSLIFFMVVSHVFSRSIKENNGSEIEKRGLIDIIFGGGSTKSSISDIYDAISHYRGKSGKTVSANKTLINEIKSDDSYKDMISNLKQDIKNQITNAKIQNGETIQNPSGLNEVIGCTTLGNFHIYIEYSFVPRYGNNYVELHLTGTDRWDFEWNSNYGVIQNIIREKIPSLIAGDGKPFDVTVDFYDDVTITY